MSRSAAALAAILLVPGIALSQEAPRETSPEPDSLHTVERGESLWNLARQYYDDPFDWRRIFQANQEAIDDPHWIYPGQYIEIPGVTGSVTGVRVAGERAGEAGEEEGTVYRGIHPDPGNRTVFSDPPRDDVTPPAERTAFYPEASEARRGGVLRGEGVEHLAVSRDDFYSAEWLVPDGEAEFQGRVVGWAGEGGGARPRETAFPYDRLRIEWRSDDRPGRGDLLQTGRVVKSEDGIGQIVRPSGIVRVVEVVQEGLVAVSLTEYNRLLLGDFVLRAPSFPLEPGQYAEEVDGGIRARITGFARSRSVQQVGDVAFIDAGASDGVSVGDEFELRTSPGGGWSGEFAGELQVVKVLEDRASARISRLVSPVFRAGLQVRMAGKMP